MGSKYGMCVLTSVSCFEYFASSSLANLLLKLVIANNRVHFDLNTITGVCLPER